MNPIDQAIIADMVHTAFVPPEQPADDYSDVGPETRHDPDDHPEPWPDGPCRNCGGSHHVQRCPEVLAALLAPLTGAEIARAWHRDYRGFARRIGQKPASERIRAAYLYTRYMTERLPRQRYRLALIDTLAAWERAAA